MSIVLRNFLYLNEAMVDDYLAAIEGGVTEEVSSASKETISGATEGKIGLFGSGIKGGVTGHSETSDALKIKLNHAARFHKLHGHLVHLELIGDSKLGGVVEEEGQVAHVGLERLRLLADTMSSMGAAAEDPVSVAKANAIKTMLAGRPLELLLKSDSGTDVLRLNREHLRSAIDEGQEVHVLGKVMKIIPPGAVHYCGEFFQGFAKIPGLSDQLKVELEKQPQFAPFIRTEISGPARVISPVAIYTV